jgi:hypothetical protein
MVSAAVTACQGLASGLATSQLAFTCHLRQDRRPWPSCSTPVAAAAAELAPPLQLQTQAGLSAMQQLTVLQQSAAALPLAGWQLGSSSNRRSSCWQGCSTMLHLQGQLLVCALPASLSLGTPPLGQAAAATKHDPGEQTWQKRMTTSVKLLHSARCVVQAQC